MMRRWLEFRKAVWDGRTPRERQTIAAATILLLPPLVYLVLWQPAHSALARLHATLPVMRMQAATMKRQATQVELLRHRPQPAILDALALKAAVQASAARFQLSDAVERLDVLEPNGVHIAFASVPFAQWLRWVRNLRQEQHVRIESLDIVALPAAGMVKINANLINGASR